MRTTTVQMGRTTTRKHAVVHLDAQRRWCPVLGRGARITRPVGDTTPDVKVLCKWCFTTEHVAIAAQDIAYAARRDERATRVERHLTVIGRAIETPAEAAAIDARIAEERAELAAIAEAQAIADAAWDAAHAAPVAATVPAQRPTLGGLFTHPDFVARRNMRVTRTGRLVAA